MLSLCFDGAVLQWQHTAIVLASGSKFQEESHPAVWLLLRDRKSAGWQEVAAEVSWNTNWLRKFPFQKAFGASFRINKFRP